MNKTLHAVGLGFVVVGFIMLIIGYGQARALAYREMEEGGEVPDLPWHPSPEENATLPNQTPQPAEEGYSFEISVFGVTLNLLEICGLILMIVGFLVIIFG